MGIPPDSMGTPGPSTRVYVAGPGAPASGGQSGAGSRRLKLSAVLDPTLDADVVSLGNLEIQKLYADYKAKFGDHPSAEADLSAVPGAKRLNGWAPASPATMPKRRWS